jgi:glyoxylase-like metal-dependent hydrolase (beta-lactamase superfamily II)
MSSTTYELFAVKYAEFDRPALENFVFRDVHDGPMPLDFFVWVAKSPERTFVIDTGFSEAVGARRDRRILRNPREGLAALDIDAARIEDMIVTHMHYDHVGNFEIFPRALPSPGPRDGVRHRPAHVPRAPAHAVRHRERHRHGARGLSRPRRVPRRQR